MSAREAVGTELKSATSCQWVLKVTANACPATKKFEPVFFEEIPLLLGISIGEQICPVFSLQNEPNGRFEPIEAVGFKRLQFAPDFGLPVDQSLPRGLEIIGRAQPWMGAKAKLSH